MENWECELNETEVARTISKTLAASLAIHIFFICPKPWI